MEYIRTCNNLISIWNVTALAQLLLLFVMAGSAACSINPFSNVGLGADFYSVSCPHAFSIVKSVVEKAVEREARMGASLLRLHFHDCFVQGCDGSVLLDDTPSFKGEKTAVPNSNSIRGFDVVDEIKSQLESACPGVVSCADILAIAARDSVVLSGGLKWDVLVGRRDSRSASFSGANHDIPAPNSTLQTLLTKFKRHGLDVLDLVALSGGHTIGQSRCITFRQRLYMTTNTNFDESYSAELRSSCPRSGGDNILSPLDVVSPTKFDNHYFTNLESGRGLLISDQDLYGNQNGQDDQISSTTTVLVTAFAEDEEKFLQRFAESMVRMGNIKPLTGSRGEIRKNCRRMN